MAIEDQSPKDTNSTNGDQPHFDISSLTFSC